MNSKAATEGHKVTIMANANHETCFERKKSHVPSAKVPQKYWQAWQLTVKCSCSDHVRKEERKTRQQKINDLIEILRRHKQLSQVKSKRNEFETNAHVVENPGICKEKCTDPMYKDIKIPTALKTEENSQDFDGKQTMSCNSSLHTFVLKRSHKNTLGNAPNFRRNSEEMHLKRTFSIYHRYEAQQKIIARQKTQLLHQERIINNFTLENLSNQSRLSASKTLHEIHTYNLQLKRCRQNKTKNSQFTENNCLELPEPTSSQPKCEYLRNEKWRCLMKKRKEQKEKERLLKKDAELKEQKQLEKKEKLKILLEVEEKKLQKLLEDKKKKEAKEKLKEVMHLANEHYNKKLLKKYGIEALRNYVVTEKERVMLMTEYYRRKLLVKHFYEWQKYARYFHEQKIIIATSFYYIRLIRKCFKSFSKNVQGKVHNEQVADDFYCMKLVEVIFHKWHLHSYREQVLRDSILKHANTLYGRKLKMNAFKAWSQLPAIVREEREREKRKEFWREKVREILPDFSPSMKGDH